jgi:hypothetical protein
MSRPTGSPPDRRLRLAVFGLVAILTGIGSSLLGLAHLLLLFFPLPDYGLGLDEPGVTDTRSLAMGAVIYVMIGAIFVVSGVGSIRCRRWVQPVMVVLAWTWLLAGVMALAMIYGSLSDLWILATSELNELPLELELWFRTLVLGIAGIGGVLLPTLFLIAYRPADVRAACEALDPQPTWTDRCPLSVLGLAGGLGLAAAFALPMALVPVVPVFGQLWTGPKGVAATLSFAIVAGWLARATFRLERRGLWGTLLLLVLLGLSVAVTFARIELIDYYRAMGYPERHLARLARADSPMGAILVWGSLGMTLASLGYLASIRVHFRSPGD